MHLHFPLYFRHFLSYIIYICYHFSDQRTCSIFFLNSQIMCWNFEIYHSKKKSWKRVKYLDYKWSIGMCEVTLLRKNWTNFYDKRLRNRSFFRSFYRPMSFEEICNTKLYLIRMTCVLNIFIICDLKLEIA